MRVFVVHDAQGNISAAVTAPDDSAIPAIATPSGLAMTEISDLPIDPEEFENREKLEEFAADFRVDVVGMSRRAAVVRRTS
ncbi:hypothetical protein [Streptomyces sp. NPDC001530]|uniref:hypothetical protein n=1 Tax=Streptomyces sp. NPDC001530 TaxID=3364582 RepID=UPI0036CE6DA7